MSLEIEKFEDRHLGPAQSEIETMLRALGHATLEKFADEVIPKSIRIKEKLKIPAALSERESLDRLREISNANLRFRSFIGTGYVNAVTPLPILRNIFENPAWYTQYTPYQAEISQGRLEALLNFQTMVSDLTGFPVSNASLLDEATAAAEAMAMCHGQSDRARRKFFVSAHCHPQTIAVCQTRAEPIGIEIVVGDEAKIKSANSSLSDFFGALFQYPHSTGELSDPAELIQTMKAAGAMTVLACDILSLCLIKSPGELGADVAVGSTQRFGVPIGFGGPHAAFIACDEKFKRSMPGRIVGLSKDKEGRPAIRLALQTREQHIRREKATSNICTAQVLLAVMASMYAVYHGPKGLRRIAKNVAHTASAFSLRLKDAGIKTLNKGFFDTVLFEVADKNIAAVKQRLNEKKINLRQISQGVFSATFDEATELKDLGDLVWAITGTVVAENVASARETGIPKMLERKSEYLEHPVFSQYQTETELLRYMKRLESRDISLAHSMIPLGSCTMKLNATAEMIPVTWAGFSSIHPHVPREQVKGYLELFSELERYLAEITGFDAVSLQPNAGSQGEYAGLLAIKKYHETRGDKHRNVCLIPKSAHGTNPASAVMAGMSVVVVECDRDGNVSIEDHESKARVHAEKLSALMVTYPSTHGVFETEIRKICEIVHNYGGLVYMDGANLNAQVGLCRPGDYGPDVCHLNLHKTFAIPHGGGGPGMGPIAVKAILKDFLPGAQKSLGMISAAQWGSASILPISWAYIRMLGAEGLRKATQVAILNANYVAHKLKNHYPILYKSEKGLVAHECIIDLRPLKAETGVEVEDVAKRLMDYGFHAPTISFPVPGTMMIEPTESESLAELDRFCEAMLLIHKEIKEMPSLLKNAPHTATMIASENWSYAYSRERAAFPTESTKNFKVWPYVSRIDNVYGDRNLICTCPPLA